MNTDYKPAPLLLAHRPINADMWYVGYLEYEQNLICKLEHETIKKNDDHLNELCLVVCISPITKFSNYKIGVG